MSKFSNLFIELQDILRELVRQEIARMSDEKIQEIREKYKNESR